MKREAAPRTAPSSPPPAAAPAIPPEMPEPPQPCREPELQQGKLVLDPEAPLPDALLRSFTAVAAYAAEQLRRIEIQPVRAIHEYRKSLRRLRTLARCARQGRSNAERRELKTLFRSALEGTGARRDRDVLASALERVLPERLRPTLPLLRAKLESHTTGGEVDPPPAAEQVESLLGRARALFIAGLPRRLGAGALRKGLRRTYRRARREWQRTAESPDDDAVHRFRKRVKELRYYLELYPEQARLDARKPALAELAELLGEYTDRLVLRRYLLAHENEFAPELHVALLRAIRDQKRGILGRARRRAARLFQVKPRSFVEHVADDRAGHGGPRAA